MPAFAQIDSRSKFLLSVATAGSTLFVPGLTAIDSVMTLGGFTTAAPSVTGATSGFYRDLGREVVAYDNASALGVGSVKRAVFRQVAVMNGAGSEGITGTTTALAGYTAYPYVQVFASDSTAGIVTVVRTG